MRTEERIEAPAYEGVTTLQYAEPLELTPDRRLSRPRRAVGRDVSVGSAG